MVTGVSLAGNITLAPGRTPLSTRDIEVAIKILKLTAAGLVSVEGPTVQNTVI